MVLETLRNKEGRKRLLGIGFGQRKIPEDQSDKLSTDHPSGKLHKQYPDANNAVVTRQQNWDTTEAKRNQINLLQAGGEKPLAQGTGTVAGREMTMGQAFNNFELDDRGQPAQRRPVLDGMIVLQNGQSPAINHAPGPPLLPKNQERTPGQLVPPIGSHTTQVVRSLVDIDRQRVHAKGFDIFPDTTSGQIDHNRRVERTETYPGSNPYSQSNGSQSETEADSRKDLAKIKAETRKLEADIARYEIELTTEREATKKAQKELEDLERLYSQCNDDAVRLATEHDIKLEKTEANLNKVVSEMEIAQTVFEDTLAERDQKIVELTAKLEGANRDLRVADQDLENAGKTIEALQGSAGRALDDAHFKEVYRKLRSQVRAWTEDYFKGSLCRVAKNKSADAELKNRALDCEDFIDSKQMRIKLVEAYVWWLLLDRIFDVKADKNRKGAWWAKGCRREVCGLKSQLRPSTPQTQEELRRYESDVREYHRWRATTARLIAPEISKQDMPWQIHDLAEWAYGELGCCVSEKGYQKGRNTCIQALEAIMVSAINLDQEMNAQFAFYHWKAQPPNSGKDGLHYGYGFDSAYMVIDSQFGNEIGRQMVAGEKVGMMVSPALQRTGNYRGEGFCSDPEVIAYAMVVPVGVLNKGRFWGAR